MTRNPKERYPVMTARGWTRTGLLVALVCTGGMLAACRTQVAAAGDAPPSAAPPCRRPGVVVSVGAHDAGSGHRGVVLVFTNTGAQPCRLFGYPGVAGLDAGGAQVAQARRTPNGYLGGLASGDRPRRHGVDPGVVGQRRLQRPAGAPRRPRHQRT